MVRTINERRNMTNFAVLPKGSHLVMADGRRGSDVLLVRDAEDGVDAPGPDRRGQLDGVGHLRPDPYGPGVTGPGGTAPKFARRMRRSTRGR